jgi:hypothetical protein
MQKGAEPTVRHIICFEGKEKVPGQFIAVDALTWLDGDIPVLANFDDSQLIGYGTDIRREKNGSLTAEITLLDGEKVPKGMAVSIKMYEVDYHNWREVLWITKGEIRSMALIPDMYWPQR